MIEIPSIENLNRQQAFAGFQVTIETYFTLYGYVTTAIMSAEIISVFVFSYKLNDSTGLAVIASRIQLLIIFGCVFSTGILRNETLQVVPVDANSCAKKIHNLSIPCKLTHLQGY